MDVRELIGLLSAGAIDWSATGGRSDARQMVAGALAKIRPRWGAQLLLALYAADAGAARQVELAVTVELAGMIWPEKHPPGTWRHLARMATAEYLDPPKCLHCTGTTHTWRMVDGAVTPVDCPECHGKGTRQYTDEELIEASGLPWAVWGQRYRRLHKMLRDHERAALATVRADMMDAGVLA